MEDVKSDSYDGKSYHYPSDLKSASAASKKARDRVDNAIVDFKKGKLYATSITDLLNRLLNMPCCHPCCNNAVQNRRRMKAEAMCKKSGFKACCVPFDSCVTPQLVPVRVACPRPWICHPPPPPVICHQCPCHCRPCINIHMTPPCPPSPCMRPPCQSSRQHSGHCPCPCSCPSPCRGRCCRCSPLSLPVLDCPHRSYCCRPPCSSSPCCGGPKSDCMDWCDDCGCGCNDCDCGNCCCPDKKRVMYNNCNFYSTPMRCTMSEGHPKPQNHEMSQTLDSQGGLKSAANSNNSYGSGAGGSRNSGSFSRTISH